MRNRVGRIIVALIFLVGFGFYTMDQERNSFHSVDVESWGEAKGLNAQAFEGISMEEEAPAELPEGVDMSAAQPEETVEPEATPEPTPEPTPAIPDVDINSWELILVNADNRLESDFVPPTVVTVSDSQCPIDSRIEEPLMAMAQACKDAGYSVYLSSGYRSYSEQAANFTRVCNNNGVADGKDANGFYITMPAGGSEHQTGLAVDITDKYYEIKDSSLENTDTFKWLKEHCTEYGFILRFPSDKSELTGVMYEPFHFRYVGVEAAKYITENKLCLEEFVALYQQEQ